jgi:cytochrome P450
MPPTKPDYDEVSLSHLGFWSATAAEREESFRVLRAERPLSWQPPAEGSLMDPEEPGYWAVLRHQDIRAVSKDPKAFCSSRGVQMEDVPPELLEAAQSFLGMDDPRHAALRKLVSSAFTPKRVARIEDQIAARAERIVDALVEHGDGDFVELVAKPLPMWTIYDMVGLPEEWQAAATEGADGMVSWNDEDVAAGRSPMEVLQSSLRALSGIAVELAQQRRSIPRDDLMTNLVQAEVDGEQLTDHDIASFFVLLSVAGNDTTRNTITHTMKAFTDFPDQRKLMIDDFEGHIDTAVEEFVRWASPVMTFRRTATRDTELAGRSIAEGDKVVLFYASGNRDESVFERPNAFDVTRTRNEHVGFGGGGPHFCMGNQLARTQLRAIFRRLLQRVPDLQVGEPVPLVGNFVHAVKSIDCTLNPR